MALRIAIANKKGGVAKSATAMMLAEGLALFHGLRVLAIDMDPQASLSTMLLSAQGADTAATRGRSLSHLLDHLAEQQPVHFSGLISNKASDLTELRDARDKRRVDLIASRRQLLSDLTGIERRLRTIYSDRLDVALAAALTPELDRLDRSYDVILFDCPADTGPLALAALRLSRLVIAPTILDSVSLKTLGDFLKIILEQDLTLSSHITLKVLPTMYQAGDPEQRRILDQIRAHAIRLDAITRPVPMTVHIRRAGERIRPDSYRSRKEKYEGALPDFEALAASVADIIRIMEDAR